jgi:PAS domain S-box-containing protein
VGMIAPLAANIAMLLRISPFPGLDLTPFAFVVSYSCIAVALSRLRLFDIVPIARSAIFERMTDGCIVLDAQNRVVDVNETALKLLGKSPETLIGKSAEEALSTFGDLFQQSVEIPLLRQEIVLQSDPPLVLDLRITPLVDRMGRHTGRLIVARDITDRKIAEQAERDQRMLAEALRDSVSALNRSHSFDEVLDKILDNVGRVVPYDLASFLLSDNDGTVHAVRNRGYEEHGLGHYIESLHFPYDQIPNFRQMIKTGQALVIPDTSRSKHWVKIEGMELMHSYVGAPIRVREIVIGFLNLASLTPNFFTQVHADRLQAFADQAAVAIENARLFEGIQERADQMTALFDIGFTIASGLDMDHILGTLLEKCQQILPVEAFYVAYYDPDTELIHHPLFYDQGIYKNLPPHNIHEQPGISGQIIQSRETIYIPDTFEKGIQEKYKLIHTGGESTRSYVGVPMVVGERVVGVISMQSYTPNAYATADIRLLETIATQAAVAIENSRLYAKAQQEILERQKAEHRYRALFEQSHDAVYILGFDGKHIEVNARAAEMLGYRDRKSVV